MGKGRGRPAATKARVENYMLKHGCDNVRQVARVLGIDRRQVQRYVAAARPAPLFISEIPEDQRERFWRSVDRTPGQGPRGDCWGWRGSICANGYPNGFAMQGRSYRASHIALVIDGRPRPSPDLLALHSCDNKACVNPSHLRWGTDAENAEDHRQRGTRGKHWLPDETVHMIHQDPGSNKEVAARFGISAAAVCNIRKGRAHRHIFEHYCRPDAA